MRRLQNATSKTIERSTTKNPPKKMDTEAKMVSVYDGDTCDLIISRNKKLERHKCRLADIDAPELKPAKTNKALKARDYLAWWGTGKYRTPSRFAHTSSPWSEKKLQSKLDKNKHTIHAEFHGIGRYRRPIVTLKKTKKSRKTFNQYLMERGYAKRYRK